LGRERREQKIGWGDGKEEEIRIDRWNINKYM
jgi:hypothetical protein